MTELLGMSGTAKAGQPEPEAGYGESDIAIVGMAVRLPGAAGIDAYWNNLRNGTRSIRRLTAEELQASGEKPHLLARPDYVPFAAPLDDFSHFDAEFFGLSPKDAAIMDPQHRQFLECAWEAMENAAHVPIRRAARDSEGFDGPIGVFAGCGMGSYFYFNLCSNPDLVEQTGMFLLRHTGNDKDFLSTRLSHVFDLRGPSMSVQTACSTSLVATHLAAQSLLNGECDMALAGGVTIELPQARGYLFKEGEILSPDGECHAFDHRAQGTVFGSGVGVVVLRRMADAVSDGDHIWAVIKGSAINNDGADKAGYLAPSVGGQAAAIAEAQAVAGVSAETVDYIECHGTGTYLGDPIEIAALTEAFRRTTDAEDFCRIGSVKTNIGHTDTAAGVASLVKTSLALHHGEMPPSLGYESPNPAIGFEGSPFRVNDRLTPWPARAHPPRAGVNSLGVGGTNAHVVLQAAPRRPASQDSDWPFQLFTLSARSKAALDGNAAALAAHLRTTGQPLADIAFTLKDGRRAFERRRVIVARTAAEAADLLTENDPRRVFSHTVVSDRPAPVFMFPGGGAQYAGMARDLYETEPTFADWMDRGLDILEPMLDYDIRALWLPEKGGEAAADAVLQKPSVQLPLIMITEYALAQLWMAWGVAPTALIGHSMGENTAACLAGVLSFEDCIGLIHLRGTLFDEVPAGGMISVALSADALRPYLGETLDLAGINAPQLSVATGPQEALDALAARLKADDIDHQRIAINIAAHSRMLEGILGRFGDYLRSIVLSPPQIPLVSNRTGTWITDAEATSPDYWVAHLRGTVDFVGGLTTLAEEPERIYIEVGPGKALSSLAGQHGKVTANQVIGSLRHPKDGVADDAYFMAQLGRVWATGGTFDWAQVWGDARRNRVPLPTYAFQHSPYFIDARAPETTAAEPWLMRTEDREAWSWAPAWRPAYAACDIDTTAELGALPPQRWLIFACDTGTTDAIARRLKDAGQDVISARPGDGYARLSADAFQLAPEHGRESYDQMLHALAADGRLPDRIVHGWLLTADEAHRPGSSFFHRTQEQGFWSLFYLAQSWAAEASGAPHIAVLTNGAVQVRGEPLPYPEKSTVAGPARVIPREFPGMTTQILDIDLPQGRRKPEPGRVAQILEDLLAPPANGTAALRGGKRYALGVKQIALPDAPIDIAKGSTVLLTGGFGGIGLTVAEALIRDHGAKIALVARQSLPPRAEWDAELRRLAPGSRLARRIAAVQALEAAGGQVMTLAADVSNIEDMRAAKAEIETTLGPIRGVVHAAGVIDDAPILAKQPMAIEEVFTPKIHGTQVLGDLFPDGSLDWMALFSSTSTVTAPGGQVDYVAANEYLNAFAKSRSGGQTRVIAVNWGLWAEVGMAADAMEARTGTAAAPDVAIAATMLDTAGFDETGARRFRAEYETSRWFVDEHRTKAGDALIPGTGYLELAAESLAAQGENMPFAIEDLHFLRPLRVDAAGAIVSVTLPRSDEGYDLRIASAPPGMEPELNAEGRLNLLPVARPAPLDLVAIAGRMGAAEQGDLRSPQEAHLQFGPRWRVLKSRAYGAGEALARLALPQAARGDGAILHPALMDLATGWAMGLIAGYDARNLWVPVSYGVVRVFAPLPAEIVSHVRTVGTADAGHATATFDITLAAPDGTVLVQIEDFTIRQMTGAVRFGAPKPAQSSGPRPLSPAEERLRHNLTQGIPPADGAALFLRAMAAPHAQTILTSLPLDGLIAQADAAETKTESQSFERPQLDSDYVAPETDIEKRLAGFWQDLLGVAQVGVEDSFFDLGGHSLIAVRLFAMVKKAFAVDFPISILFEAPTIRACAALIAERGGLAEDSSGGDVAKAAAPTRRFTHLVPMHGGEGGPKTPFFLVAGMFGNVLNLRHLAHLLGTDRPFYGLQARGLYGDAAPHDNLVDAARDMIVEIRAVQPHGPYMVGGFSGGGITAYEIARQLTDAGEEIASIVMLDTPLPQRRPLSREDRMTIQWQELRAGGIGYPVRWVTNRIKWEIEKRRPKVQDDSAPAAFHDTAIEAAFYAAIARYDVRPWSGPLTLFRPPQRGKWEVSPGRWVSSERAYVLPDNDWTGAAPEIEVIEVPGDHDSMVLEPNVRVLAARMRKVIESAERAARRRPPADQWATDKAAE